MRTFPFEYTAQVSHYTATAMPDERSRRDSQMLTRCPYGCNAKLFPVNVRQHRDQCPARIAKQERKPLDLRETRKYTKRK